MLENKQLHQHKQSDHTLYCHQSYHPNPVCQNAKHETAKSLHCSRRRFLSAYGDGFHYSKSCVHMKQKAHRVEDISVR